MKRRDPVDVGVTIIFHVTMGMIVAFISMMVGFKVGALVAVIMAYAVEDARK